MAIDITSSARRVSYTGNGATTAYAVNFQFYSQSDLVVYVASTLKSLGSDYTVSGAGSASGGTVTFTVAPANGASVVIYGDAPIENTTHFPLTGNFNVEALNVALNRQTIFHQQLANKLSRTIRLADSDSGTGLTLPDAATRASKFLGFDVSGNPIAAAGTSANLGPVSTFINTLLDDADAAAARTTLGAATNASSSTTASGLVELATQAEFDAGTDSTRALTTDIIHGATPTTVTMDTANDKAWIKDATDGKLKLALIPAGASGEVNTAAVVGTGADPVAGKSGTVIQLRGFKISITNASSGTGNGLANAVLSGTWTAAGNDITLNLTLTRTYTDFSAPSGGGGA